jgi:hypothetical protein
MRLKAVMCVAAAAMVLTGCANVPKKAFNKEGAAHIQTVAVSERTAKESYSVTIVAHPGVNFGLIGGLVAAADMAGKSDKLTTALNPSQTQVQKRFSQKLSDALKSGGYDTSVMTLADGVAAGKAFDAVRPNLKSDAFIDLDVQAGYVAAGPSSDYLPFVRVAVLNTDAKSGGLVYQDTITYGYTFEGGKTVHLTSDKQYRFKDMDDLLARSGLAREGLYAGLDLIATQIAADLKR